MERWKWIAGWEGKYKVSSHGRIKSVARKRKCGRVGDEEIILTPKRTANGYSFVTLYDKGRYVKSIHRAVAEAFIENSYNKPEVNHKNGDRTDNHMSNLEWCTRSENVLHAYRVGLAKGPKGSKQGNAKLHESIIGEIRGLYAAGVDEKEIAAMFGVHHTTIKEAATGKTWPHV